MINDILSYLIIFFLIFNLYGKNFLSSKDLIIYSLFLTSPFFFNNFLIDWTKFYDQVKYINVSNYIRQNILSGNFPYFFMSPEKGPSVYFSSLIFSLFPIISFNTINSVAFCSKGIYLLTLIFLNYRKKIPFILKFYFLFSPSIFFYSSLSLRDLLVLSLMLLSFYLLIIQNFGIKLFLILSFLFLIKIQNFFIVLAVYGGYWIFVNFYRYNLNKFLAACLIMFSLVIFFNNIFFDNIFFDKIEFYRKGFFSEIRHYTDAQSELKYNHYYKLELSYLSIFLVLKAFIKVLLFPIFSNLNYFYFFFSFLDLIITIVIFWLFFYSTNLKNKKNSIYWLLVAFIYIFILANINFNDITITRYKFPVLTFILYCKWLTDQKINNK